MLNVKGSTVKEDFLPRSEVEHVSLPGDAVIEVRKLLMNARKRARETDSVISKIYVEDVGQIFNREYDFEIAMSSHTSTNQSLIAFGGKVRDLEETRSTRKVYTINNCIWI